MLGSREVAFKILLDIWDNQAYSNLTINKHIEEFDAYNDENFIREIVYGVLENEIYIDHIIEKMSKIKLDRIHKHIFIILRMGIYQMVFMDGIPDRAAVHESVELVKTYGNRGSRGFVNGMLRNFSRNKEKLSKIRAKDKLEELSIKYSHPLWMVEYFIDEFGYDFAEELCRANNERPSFTIRANKLQADKKTLKKILMDKGLEVREANYSTSSLLVENPKSVTSLDEFKKGFFSIQDESSSLVGEIMNPREDSLVLDLCAAPGGKATHMAEIMNNKGKIMAGDIHPHRVNLIKENAKRLKIDIIEAVIEDAIVFKEEYRDKFDYCLVDAPCSGLGTIRRNPEIKLSKDDNDINNLVEIQKNILDNAKNYIKKEGTLIYSTCTIGSRENDQVVKEFLRENENFELVDISLENIESKDKFLKLYPNVHGTDGFFIAKMIRKK